MIHISGKFKYVSFRNKNNKLHREDVPAVINGDWQEWWIEGKRHRLDGPAVIRGDYQEWWIEGKLYNEYEYLVKQEQYLEKKTAIN